MVKSVLQRSAKGYGWDHISYKLANRLSHEATAEAITLAGEALVKFATASCSLVLAPKY
jgi:hypothetical protein